MRRSIALAIAFATSAWSSGARAANDGAASESSAVPNDFPRLVFDTGRADVPPPDPDAYRFFVRGTYQLRYQAQRSFPLSATASAIDRKPGLIEQSIGQNHFLHHWLRLTPRLQLRDTVEIVGQLDLVTGLIAGETARDTRADETPRDTLNGFSNVQPRWLYADWRLPFGLLRVGQQPNHWGMGILANDGDHPPLFGDYRYGSISERILFATKPGGRDSNFYLAVAGDLVFRDQTARLTRGQKAFQGVLSAFYERGPNRVGIFSTFRHQENDKPSGRPVHSYTDELDAIAIDLHGRVVAKVPGDANAFIYGEAEAAYIIGSTNFVRTADQLRDNGRTAVRSYGGAAIVGVVHRTYAASANEDPRAKPEGAAAETGKKTLGAPDPRAYGDLVAQVEVGYASGDADPYDGTQRRFLFDPNHRIGLLLFDEVLRFQTARAATAAMDPLLSNAARPTPGVDLLPSNGGVFAAQYINPTIVYRPRHWLDLKGGMVLAQSTSDVVDPYRLATGGSYVNYRGGDPRKKDLGVELDGGIESRIALRYGLTAQIGAQAGVLFPGGALEDANGVRLSTQWIAVGRLGLLF
jgi:hypothetical protein